MASGCILGDCYCCDDPVFEDEASYNHVRNAFKHHWCKPDGQLVRENAALRKEIERLQKGNKVNENVLR
jgi:hypothetical protein